MCIDVNVAKLITHDDNSNHLFVIINSHTSSKPRIEYTFFFIRNLALKWVLSFLAFRVLSFFAVSYFSAICVIFQGKCGIWTWVLSFLAFRVLSFLAFWVLTVYLNRVHYRCLVLYNHYKTGAPDWQVSAQTLALDFSPLRFAQRNSCSTSRFLIIKTLRKSF